MRKDHHRYDWPKYSREYRLRHPEKAKKAVRDSARRKAYGQRAVVHFEKQKKKQKNKCAICGSKMKLPCQDHNHRTGKLRGLVCHKCNWKIGTVENSPIKKILAYLKRWK